MKIHNPSLLVARDLDGKLNFLELFKDILYIYLWTNCRRTEYMVMMSKGVSTKKLQLMIEGSRSSSDG